MNENSGIVYVLTNPAMPNMIKIGMTTGEDVKSRMAQLYTTGVPVPFECVYAARVANHEAVEKALHTAFGPDRVNPRREFFEIEPMQAIAIISLMALEDVTPQVAAQREQVDAVDREAGEEYARKRRPRFSFNELGIPVGSELINVSTGEPCTVINEREVLFRNGQTSLTNATRTALDIAYNVQPAPYWTFNGRSLRDIYNEVYPVN